jgi:hypothetical protein
MPYPGTHAYLGAVTPAKPAFGNFNQQLSCAERLQNIKLNIEYCECKNNNRPLQSQSEMLAFRKIKTDTCNGYCDRLPFDKTALQVNLITQLDMSGTVLISDVANPSVPSGMYPTAVPYYDFYYFDPYGALFGKRQCEINKYVNYMVISTIPFKIYPPANYPNAVNNSQSHPG